MELSDKLKEYMGVVKERITNPTQTLATALKEGMPTEENPLGMFGIGSISKIEDSLAGLRKIVRDEIASGKVAEQTNQKWGKFTTKEGDIFKEQPDGSWDSGKEVFSSMADFLKNRGVIK